MKPRDYCCCAIPTVNAGVYAVLVEHFVLALVVGTLAVAAPSIVGAESFTSWPLAIICYANAAIQIFGFMGVARDNNIIFRRYITLHILTSVGAFAVAGAMIGMSAGRHNTAQNDCIEDFFSSNSTSTTGSATSSLGNTLCNIFPWVDVGVMGGLWILLALSQIYFYTVISGYGVWQREPRDKYDSVTEYSGLAGDIPMANRSDPWDSHASDDRLAGYNGQHARTGSAGVRLDEPYTDAPHEPTVAHTQYGAPTPAMQEPVHFQSRGYEGPYYSGSTTGISRPEQYQPHPAEGSFGRKTPRLQKARFGTDF